MPKANLNYELALALSPSEAKALLKLLTQRRKQGLLEIGYSEEEAEAIHQIYHAVEDAMPEGDR